MPDNKIVSIYREDISSNATEADIKKDLSTPKGRENFLQNFDNSIHDKVNATIDEFLGIKKSTPPQGGTSVKPVLSSGGISKTSSSGNTVSKSESSEKKTDFSQGALNFQQAYAKQVADKTGTSTAPKFKTYSVIDQSKEAKASRAKEAASVNKLVKDSEKAKLEQEKQSNPYLGGFTTGVLDFAGKAVRGAMLSNKMSNPLIAMQYGDKIDEELSKENTLERLSRKSNENYAKFDEYKGSAWDAFQNGDISHGLENTRRMIAQSIPTSVAIANPQGATLWAIGSVDKEQRDLIDKGVDPKTALISATGKVGLEFATEKLLGGAKVINGFVKSMGKEAAKKAVINQVKKSFVKEFGKSIGENELGELSNQVGSNLIKHYIDGDSSVKWNDGLGDTFISALGSSTTYAPLVAITVKGTNQSIDQVKQNEDNLRQEQLGMAYENNKQEELKEQQLNQEYNESKSSNEGQAIEGNVSESGIVSEGQGDRQSEGLQGGEQGGLEIRQNASDENGSQEVTTSQGIIESTLESEGETFNSNVGTEIQQKVSKKKGSNARKKELQKAARAASTETLQDENDAIDSDTSEQTEEKKEKAVAVKSELWNRVNNIKYELFFKLEDIKEKAKQGKQVAKEVVKDIKNQLKVLNAESTKLAKQIIKNSLGSEQRGFKKAFDYLVSKGEKLSNTDINELLDFVSEDVVEGLYDEVESSQLQIEKLQAEIEKHKANIDTLKQQGKDAVLIEKIKKEEALAKQKQEMSDKILIEKIKKEEAIEKQKQAFKDKFNAFKEGINDAKADKKKVISDFINAIDPKAKISPRQLTKILNAINTGNVNSAIKATLSLANSANKSILAKEFNAVKQALKKVKFATVTDNNKLVKKLTEIGSIPDVFKEDYIKEVGALLDTYKTQGRLNTKEAQRLIDKYTPIWEETKTQNQLTRDVNLIASELDGTAIRDLDFIKEIRDAKSEFEKTLTDKGKLPSKKAVNDFVNNLIENLTVDQINEAVSKQKLFEEQEIAKLDTEEKVTPSEEQKQKALVAAESILDDIDYIINNTDIEGFDKYKDLTAEDIQGVLLLGNGKFDKAKFRNINEVLKNMYNGIDAAVNQVTGLLDASVRMKNKSSIKWGDINIKSLRDNAKNIIEKIGGVIAHYKGVHSKLLKIANNNIQRVQQIEELIGRDDAFKKRTQDIININDKFNDFLNNIRGGIGNIFTDKVDSRKQQTIARILSQLLQIPVNLDNEAQIAYVKKRISEVLKSQSTLTEGVEDGYTNDQKQEMQAHKDVLSALENLGIKIEDGSITEIPFESFDDFESAIKGIEAFKKHNELLTKIANFLQTEGYSDIMEEHSWKDYGRTLERFTNYIPFFYSSPKDISNKDLFVSGGNLAGNIASAVKQRMGLGANQYMAGDFLVSLDTTHQQSVTDALFCKGNIVTDNILNSNKVVDIFNQGATKNEAGYNQGVIVAKTLKNIFSEYNQVAKFGSLKDGNETQPALDAFAKLQSLGNKIALSNVKLFFSQTPSQFVTVIGQMMKHMINTKGNFDALKNILPIIPLYMQNSARGRFAYMAGIGSIINEVNDLQVGDEGKWWNISTGTKLDEVSNAIGVASRTVGKVQTNYNKYNTAMADFMSRSMIFYLAAQSYAHQAGIDITANDFWDVMENGYVNEDPTIMRIVEKAKYDSNLQGDLTKPTQSKAQTSTKATSRLFKLTLGNMKGFSVLQQEALINRTKIAFSPNNTNTMKDRFDAGMDVFTILAANFTYGITRVGAGMAAKTATVGILGFALSLIKGDDDEEDKDGVVKRIDHLLEEIRDTKHDPINMKDLMFIGTTSAIGSTLPSYLGLDEMSTYSLSEMGVYEGIRKVYDPQYKYLKETDEAHKGNTKYELGKTVQFMEQGVMPFTGGSILEMPKLTFINDTWDLCRSFKNVMADETLSPYAKDYYKKGLRIACARALSYVPVANIPSLIGNTLGLDSRLDQEFKESIKVADAIEGVDKWGNKNEGKGGLRVGIGSLEREAKGNYISKNRVEALRQKGDSNSSGILINQADREIIRDYRIKNTK